MNNVGAQYVRARARWGTNTVSDWYSETLRDGEKWLEQSHYVKPPATAPKGKRRVVVNAEGSVAGPLEPGVGLMTSSQEWESVARGVGYALLMWDGINSPTPDPAEVAQYDEQKRKEQVEHYNQKRRSRRQFAHDWIKQNYPGFFEAHYRPPTHAEITAPERRGLPGDDMPLTSAGRPAEPAMGTPQSTVKVRLSRRKNIRMSPEEYERLEQAAKTAGKKPSALARQLLREGVEMLEAITKP